MSGKDFVLKHSTGWICACMTVVVGVIVNNIYEAILSPYQAQIAAGQLDDSVSSWVVHQQMSYGDLIPNLIVVGTVILFGLFLLPTITHAIRLAKTDS